MKKLISLMLALVLVFSMATVALADVDTNVDTSKWTSEAKTAAIELTKVYTVSGATVETLYPAETLKFSVAEDASNPDTLKDHPVTVDALEVKGNSNQAIKINLPSYDKVGVYVYNITENGGSTQGVGYTKATISIKVLVTYDYTNKCLGSEVVLNTSDNNGKVDTFTNTYDVGTLTVKKTISGNLASSDAYFEMTVTLKATGTVASDITISGGSNTSNPTTIAATDWENGSVTKTIYLKAGDTLTFSNIPAGVTYEVKENSKHLLAEGATLNPNSDADKEYTVSYTNETGTIAKAETDEAFVKNTKATEVSTGITLDSMPFVLMLVVCAGAAVLFIVNKRRSVEF